MNITDNILFLKFAAYFFAFYSSSSPLGIVYAKKNYHSQIIFGDSEEKDNLQPQITLSIVLSLFSFIS